MTEPAAAPKLTRYAKGVRGVLPAPKKTAAQLTAIRAEVAGLGQLEAVTRMRDPEGPYRLTMDQCGQVLGVSENRIARILKPQGRPAGTVGVRCIACRWRGERLITSHEDCPACGADHEQVVPSAGLKWVQVPIPVDALAALGPDYDRALCKLVAPHIVRLMRDGRRRKRT